MTEKQADEIFSKNNVYIEAPAGHGKTESIAFLARHSKSEKRLLILTHTNAGVEAIKKRMKDRKVGENRFYVSTIASYCVRWCTAYPATSGIDISLLPRDNDSSKYYDQMYPGAVKLFSCEWAREVLLSSYCAVVVDEYQDCTNRQHEFICKLNETLPVCVFGDPLQGIFSFTGDLFDWSEMPFEKYDLNTVPHRWGDSNPQLGNYLTEIRSSLMPVLDRKCCKISVNPDIVERLDVNFDPDKLLEKLERYSSVAFITEWKAAQSDFCRKMKGTFKYDETKDCPDLFKFAETLDKTSGKNLAHEAVSFVNGCIYAFDGERLSLEEILAGETSSAEFSSALNGKKYDPLVFILERVRNLERGGSFRIYREELFEEMTRCAKYAASNGVSVHDAASVIRFDPGYKKDYDSINFSSERALVSSRTLLSKGLEFECVIIDMKKANSRNPSSHLGAREFYVAMTRARKKIFIVSDTLNFLFEYA